MSLLHDEDTVHSQAVSDDTQQAEATQVVESAAAEHRQSLWSRLRGGSLEERLHNLNWSIAAFPDVAANYVVRGELMLEHGDLVQAIGDFRRALELSAKQFETDDWGVVAQAMQDRALTGLRDALRRAARYNRQADQANNNDTA